MEWNRVEKNSKKMKRNLAFSKIKKEKRSSNSIFIFSFSFSPWFYYIFSP